MLALANGLNQLYPEQKPETLQDKAREVATFFQKERFATKKELLKMTQLTADCSKVFPPDFASIVPKDVVKAVRKYNEYSLCLLISVLHRRINKFLRI